MKTKKQETLTITFSENEIIAALLEYWNTYRTEKFDIQIDLSNVLYNNDRSVTLIIDSKTKEI